MGRDVLESGLSPETVTTQDGEKPEPRAVRVGSRLESEEVGERYGTHRCEGKRKPETRYDQGDGLYKTRGHKGIEDRGH